MNLMIDLKYRALVNFRESSLTTRFFGNDMLPATVHECDNTGKDKRTKVYVAWDHGPTAKIFKECFNIKKIKYNEASLTD